MEMPSLRRMSSTFFASARISGPIPSPARSAIFTSGKNPGLGALALLLVLPNLLRVLEREPDFVQAVHEVFLPRGLDVEVHRLLVGRRDGLRRQIDRELVPVVRRDLVEEVVELELLQHDREEPVLEAVVEEDVGERRSDHRLEAVLLERPRRVLARGAAAEVLPRDEDG